MDTSLQNTTKMWARIGFLSFGGPAAQIALMHRETVEDRKLLREDQFLNALNFCMLLPGPEAMQLATYIGWRINGFWGGLIAGVLFVLPGAFIIAALASLYVTFGDVPLIDALFLGVKAVVVVIVIEALLRISRKALKQPIHYLIAAAAFLGIYVLQIPYPLIVIGAAVLGWLFLKDNSNDPSIPNKTSLSQTLKTAAYWLAIWWIPILAITLLSQTPILSEIALFFSKLAVVTFGGAYAVLAYMTQEVVTLKGWLTTGEMIDGLGLAETTPGPLILVTEFVGFVAGFKEGGWALAFGAAFVTLWVTFVPCFLWIFVGAPYIDWISAQPRLRNALSAITAAVVGVILNLSLWFAAHVYFETVESLDFGFGKIILPHLNSVNMIVCTVSLVSAYLLLVRHMNVIWVLLIAAVASVGLSAVL